MHLADVPAFRSSTSLICWDDTDMDFCVSSSQLEIEPNLGRLIGAGGFGRVYECVWKGRRVAVKCVTTCDTEAQYQVGVAEK